MKENEAASLCVVLHAQHQLCVNGGGSRFDFPAY